MSPVPDQLDALLALITSAVGTIKASYSASNQPIPDLNDPAEVQVQGIGKLPGEEVQNAAKLVSGACSQLVALIQPPESTLIQIANSHFESAALRVLSSARVADHLLAHPSGLPISDLSAQCKIDADKLARLLRLLACRHVFREVRPGVFANTRLSTRMVSSSPLWDFLGHMTDECFHASASLYDALSSNSPKTPFAHAYGFDGGFWAYVASVDKPMGERFGRAMAGSGASAVGPLLTNFPWAELPDGTTICDVGGGIGTMSLALAQRFPHLWLVLQDVPPTLEQARREWGEKAPEVVRDGRVEFVDMDFLKEQPREGCGYYYLKHILHDWPDEETVQILRNVRKSMRPGSKILLHEFVMQPLFRVPTAPDTDTGSSAHPDTDMDRKAQAPEPLLPNYGVGGMRGHYADMAMMCMLGSKERTLDEFRKLGTEAGLEFVRLWDLGSDISLLEFGLA